MRLEEGTRVARLATLAADRIGIMPSNILIYRGITNNIVKHDAEIHTAAWYQYCTSVPLPTIHSETWAICAKVREPHLNPPVRVNFPGVTL